MVMRDSKSVLVVEDDAGIRDQLSRLLKSSGIAVIEACRGEEALSLAGSQDFSLILLDLRMPGMDGVSTLQKLRSNLKPFPPVLVMVAEHTHDSIVLQAYSEGAVDVLTKPLNLEVLQQKVQILTQMRRDPGTPQTAEALRQYNDMLAYARAQAVEAGAAKASFLANISHELRTPLNAILGYAEMLHEETHEAGHRGWAKDAARIHLAAEHLLEVVNGILDLAKIESGRMEVHVEEFDIRVLVQRVTDSLLMIAERRGNRLEIDIAPDVHNMQSDASKVRQVLYNLLSNACKFTRDGVIRVDVQRDHGMAADCIVFRISDTGIGIEPSDFPKLFREFSQLGSVEHRQEGTGLGLALSERFCRMLGGSIAVESHAGKGSTFTVRLPAVVSAGECTATSGYAPS